MTEGDSGGAENNTKYKDGVNRNARLVVKNISFKATDQSFREHFSKYGTVEEAKLLKTPDGRLVGSGFVHYTQVPMANKAMVATNKKPFLGRPIYVAWAVPKHKYVQENEKKKFSAPADDLDDDSKPDIKEEDSEDDTKPAKKEKKETVRVNRNARLIVRNISFKATEESLREHFEPYGTLLEVKLLKKPDGKLVGCAFVHFKNVPMATKALNDTNLKPFLGRPISVDWAVAKDKYMRHKVTQQIELESDVKKEDDSGDESTPLNVSNDELKQEVKSESDEDEESADEDSDAKGDSDESDEGGEEESDDEGEEESDDEDVGADDKEDMDFDDDQSVTSSQPNKHRIKLNDAEDGCTVFLTNVPFSVDDDQLKTFAEKTGPVKYALVCVDKLTEHSKGSAFVKFVNKDDAASFLALPAGALRLEGQALQARPALRRDSLQKADQKQPKDNRNLYLVKEGVIVAGTAAAAGVSAADMSKRLALERSKTQMLKNLNRFVSRYRLVVANLPASCEDARLRRLCAAAAPRGAQLTEARVMRDLRAPAAPDGRHPSKGYGFVMFMRHEDALACLRKLNNNPDIFDRNNRPIVSFSIEDRAALNARKKRLEKSVANNPLAKKGEGNEEQNPKGKNRKRKINAPDESYLKRKRFEKKSNGFDRKNEPNIEGANIKDTSKEEVGKFVRMPKDNKPDKKKEDDLREYTGLTAKVGSQHKIRSNQKLRTQAEIHRQNVKLEKKKGKKTWKVKAAKERVKQPKQKINKDKSVKRNKHRNRSRMDIR